MKNPEKIGNIG